MRSILMPLTSRLNAGTSATSISAVPETVRCVKPRKPRVFPQGRYDALHVARFQLDHHAAYPIGGFGVLQPQREPGNDPARDQAIQPSLKGAAGDAQKLGQYRNRGPGIDPKFGDQAVVEVVHRVADSGS
jgi:hypothetical protein